MSINPLILKTLVIGCNQVGKSQLINRFVNDKFNEESQAESASNLHFKNWEYNEQPYELQILEAGPIDENSDFSVLVKGIEVFIFVFDLTNIQSYDLISGIIAAIAQNNETQRDVMAIVLGNKVDLSERLISYEEGQVLGKKVGEYLQVSAKTGENVQQVCDLLWNSEKMLKIYKNGSKYHNYKSINNNDPPTNKQQKQALLFYQALGKNGLHQSLSASAAPSGVRRIQFQDKQVNLIVKTLFVGEANCGKSSIAQVFTRKDFKNIYQPTIGIDFFIEHIEWRNVFFKLQIWDAAGIHSFRAITKNYYKFVDTVFLVYDITNQITFLSIQQFYNQILKVNQNAKKIQFALIGNKCDLEAERKVNRQMGEEVSVKIDCPFFEISAKTGKGIEESILSTIQSFLLKKFKQ